MLYRLEFDGACWPNPGGTAAYGYVLMRKVDDVDVVDGWEVIEEVSEKIGTGPGMTNNVAEHAGAEAGMRAALHYCVASDILEVCGDSKMVIKQIARVWHGGADKPYYKFYQRTMLALRNLGRKLVIVKPIWIPREQNQRCDDLSKKYLLDKP